MDAAVTDCSPLAEERVEIELPNLGNDYALGPARPTEEAEYAPSTSEHPGFPSEYSTAFSVAGVKLAWSWLTSAATGGRRFTALARVTPSTPAGSSPRTSRPLFLRLDSTQPLTGSDDGSSNSKDGRKPFFNRIFSTSAATTTSFGAAHRQANNARRKPHLLSTETWSNSEAETTGDATEVADSEEEGEGEVVMTGVSSGVGLWASRGILAGVSMLYGTNFGCVKLLEETVPTSLAAALRFTVAVVPFLPFLLKINLGIFRAGVEIGLFDTVGFWAQSKSLTTTTASKAAFICSLAVIIVPVMDAVFGATNREGVEAAKAPESVDQKGQGVVFAILNGPWFPALLAVAGVACLELIGVESRPSAGDAWALVQPLCFGVGFWLTERSGRNYPGDTFGIVAAHLLTVAFLAIGWCVQAGQFPVSFESLHETVFPSSGSLAVPWSLLWTGLVTTSLPAFLETLAMKKVSATESTVIFSTEPIWGTMFAAVLLGEKIGWNTGIGAALIILACTWSSVGSVIQSNALSSTAAARVRDMSAGRGIVDVDDLIETLGTNSHQEARQHVELV